MLWSGNGYVVSDDAARLDREAVYAFLRESYWARGLVREVFERSLDNSLCFGLFQTGPGQMPGQMPAKMFGAQAGFCRVVTDSATFAYLADVFVLPPHRGRGLGKWMIGCVREHPRLQGLRRWLLATADAHGLYSRHGFAPLAQPAAFMEILTPYTAAPPQDETERD